MVRWELGKMNKPWVQERIDPPVTYSEEQAAVLRKSAVNEGYQQGWEARNPLPGMLITAISGAIVGFILGAWLL